MTLGSGDLFHDWAGNARQVTKYHSWTAGSGPDGHSVTWSNLFGQICVLEIDDGNECNEM